MNHLIRKAVVTLLPLCLLLFLAPLVFATDGISPISDSMTVFDSTGAIMAQVSATEADEIANGVNFLYIINQDWGDPTQQGNNATTVMENGLQSDIFGLTNGAVAGCSFANGCLGFASDLEGISPIFNSTTVVQEGNGVFDATRYLSPTLRGEGWTATFVSDVSDVPEPSTLLLLGAGLAGVGIMRRRFKG